MRRDLPVYVIALLGIVAMYFGMYRMSDDVTKSGNSVRQKTLHSHPVFVSPRSACIQTVKKPAVYACPDKHVWMDIGPVTPVPGVPRR